MQIQSPYPLLASRALSDTTARIGQAFARIASGSRVPVAAADPAATGLLEGFRAALASLWQAQQNVSDGISLGNVADGALSSQGDLLVRMRELAVQAANGTLDDTGRAAIQTELGALRDEVDRIAASTRFNGSALLAGESFSVQAGPDAGGTIQVDTPDASAVALGLAGVSVSTAGDARNALGVLDDALDRIAQGRTQVGGALTRLSHADGALGARIESTVASLARAGGADLSAESATVANLGVRARLGAYLLRAAAANRGLLVDLVV